MKYRALLNIFVLVLLCTLLASCGETPLDKRFDLTQPTDELLRTLKAAEVVVHEDMQVTSGAEVWTTFYQQTKEGQSASVVIAEYDSSRGTVYLSELSYDGKTFTYDCVNGGENGAAYTQQYDHLLHLEGDLSDISDMMGTVDQFVLVNDPNLTLSDVAFGMYGSSNADGVSYVTAFRQVTYDVKITAQMPDVEKGYFGDGYSSVSVALNEYFTFGVTDVQVSAQSSDPTVATAQVLPNDSGEYTLELTAQKGAADCQITVCVSSALANVSLEQTFTFTSKLYLNIACVGDSLTYGHSWHNQSYPVYLAQAFGDDFDVQNFGKNGASVTGYNPPMNLKYTEQAEYANSLAFVPDVVVIMLGTNDSKGWADAEENFVDEYKNLIDSYLSVNKDVKIILVTSPPTMANNAFNIPSDIITEQIVPLQKQIAADYDLPLVDFSAKFFDTADAQDVMTTFIRGSAASDGVHLTEEGSRYLASLIAQVIKGM